MRRFLTIVSIVFTLCGVLFAQGGISNLVGISKDNLSDSKATANIPAPTEQEDEEPEFVDYKCDLATPIENGDSIFCMVGNFAAQHNGAVITCDSAVRYGDNYFEFFGNVLINKNTTYIYGDRADYNGEYNEANVYSELVKVIDGDAIFYTREFKFNTKDNIGVFDRGGYLVNRDNHLEATRGYYYADTKELVCVDDVEMRNNEYELLSDSVIYNMQTDNAYYFKNTNIWNFEGDYLYADKGTYTNIDTIYTITENGYILTEVDELWSDSLHYYRPQEHIQLYENIQIDNTEHKALLFGDYGEYWKFPGDVFVTKDPAIVSYNVEQGDSLFMRADSIHLFTRNTQQDKRDSLKIIYMDSLRVADSINATKRQIQLEDGDQQPALGGDSNLENSTESNPTIKQDTTQQDQQPSKTEETTVIPDNKAVDSLSNIENIDSVAVAPKLEVPDSLTGKDREKWIKTAKKKIEKEEKDRIKKEKAIVEKARLDSIAVVRQAKATAKLDAFKIKEEARLKARKVKAESKLQARIAKAKKRGKTIKIDSTELHEIEASLKRNMELGKKRVDTTAVDSLDSMAMDSLTQIDSIDTIIILKDSIYRLTKAYRNVKLYRSDIQSVCDSLIAISTDSTMHLYINPVLWNQANQITSDVMDIYSANQQITKAEFIGNPIMGSQVDSAMFNQVAGKLITAFFRDNEIYRNDVDANAQTVYYMQDEKTKKVNEVAVIESGSASFHIKNRKLTGITYRQNVLTTIYPLHKVPTDVSLVIKGFEWQADRRPTKIEVFNKVQRPSQREMCSKLEKPLFTISAAINRQKKKLLEKGEWSDRSDLVDPETVEWMRDLGYEVGQPREKAQDEEPQPNESPLQTIQVKGPQPKDEQTPLQKIKVDELQLEQVDTL